MFKQISVIVCTYNRAKFIFDALESLNNQSLDKSKYEVLVINNNCTDQTEDIVSKFISNHPELDIKQIQETNQGLSFARNRGIKESKYDLINFIDDDGIAEPNYLDEILNFFENKPETAGIGGRVVPIYENEEPKWLNPYLRMMVTLFDFGDNEFKCKGKKYPAGCNMTYTKQLLIDSGGFNNALKWRTDDKYIFQQISKLNEAIYYAPKVKVGHHIDANRTTDQNFDHLSYLLGSEERFRVKSDPSESYSKKVIEYYFKYFASLALGLLFGIKGQWTKGKYTIRFRKLALKGLLQGEKK